MKEELRRVIELLEEAKVLNFIQDFALTGALALSAFSKPRATKDIDIIIVMNREKVTPFYKWLKFSKNYKLVKHYKGRQIDYIKDLIELPIKNTWADFIVAPGEFEKKAVSEGISVTLFRNMKIKIVRPEFLLILKLISGSEQDYIDCAQLWKTNIDKNMVRRLAEQTYTKNDLKKIINISKKLTRMKKR